MFLCLSSALLLTSILAWRPAAVACMVRERSKKTKWKEEESHTEIRIFSFSYTMSSFSTIPESVWGANGTRFEVSDGGCAVITLDRPKKRNALSAKVSFGILKALDEIVRRGPTGTGEIRVAFLRAEGKGLLSFWCTKHGVLGLFSIPSVFMWHIRFLRGW